MLDKFVHYCNFGSKLLSFQKSHQTWKIYGMNTIHETKLGILLQMHQQRFHMQISQDSKGNFTILALLIWMFLAYFLLVLSVCPSV